ncbi:cysteine-rich CWC family protein [Chitinimonas sp. BJB300]|uniref:cysteine-rich CWC family protein n=1 Tax=Chitinimonas sp. BJB300 TaxID=1559339 RepID=UPI000C0F1FB6|nr:hypothetical protein CSQ89_13945 [Chitinimonas sp. BJB300]TSJ91308.1 cysteine-rich CWC family protein [Chitinimonas sp. BJB300]
MHVKPNHDCPLCGRPNCCALAQSSNLAAPCWCDEVQFDPAILANIPAQLLGQACICPACAKQSTENLAIAPNPMPRNAPAATPVPHIQSSDPAPGARSAPPHRNP